MRLSLSGLGLTLAAFVLLTVSLPAQADEEAVESDIMQPVQELENPYQNELRKIALELSTSLSEPELQALDKLRIAFGMVRAVGLVEGDIEVAAGKCAAENPDIAESMTTRHQAWAEAVSAERVQAEEKIEGLIAGGLFKEPAKIEAYFDATDKVATYIDEQMDKQMITTPEACNHLLGSMDETEAKLTALLQSTDWPGVDSEEEASPEAAGDPTTSPESGE